MNDSSVSLPDNSKAASTPHRKVSVLGVESSAGEREKGGSILQEEYGNSLAVGFPETPRSVMVDDTWGGEQAHEEVTKASSPTVAMAVMRERLEGSLRDKEMMRERMCLLEEELALCKEGSNALFVDLITKFRLYSRPTALSTMGPC
ncbi:hypothetical protein FOZ62_014669, partial [Perkinsus olseni]